MAEDLVQQMLQELQRPVDMQLSRKFFHLMSLPPPEYVVQAYPQPIQEVVRTEIALNRSCRYVELRVYDCWEAQFKAMRAMEAAMQLMRRK